VRLVELWSIYVQTLAFVFRFPAASWLSKSLSQKVKSPSVLCSMSCCILFYYLRQLSVQFLSGSSCRITDSFHCCVIGKSN